MADPTPAASADLTDLFKSIAGSSTTKGAALGALMTNILGQISEPGGVVQPLDMSKFGIRPRSTTAYPPAFLPYSSYAGRDVNVGMSPEQARQFGAISGLGSLVPSAALSRVPNVFANQRPMTLTSAGSGQQTAPTLSLTPRSNQQISPLTGALLGAAAGYLLPSGSAGAAGGAGGAGGTGGAIAPVDAAMELGSRAFNYVKDLFNRPAAPVDTGTVPVSYPTTYYTTPSYSTPTFGTDSSSYWGRPSKDGGLIDQHMAGGGMATPLMADGGMPPSFYTYGTAIDPQQIMQQLAEEDYAESEYASGGYAHGGLHVPTVEGRHDYRAGSRVSGEGDGQSDDIPAMLADGEYVFDADTVAQLGNGSTKAGSDLLDKFREEIRSHKRSAPVNKIPPPSKSPLQYLKQAQSRSKKNG